MDSKPTLVVCGCAMNCSEYIEGVFENIERLKEVFDLKGVIVSYDDSTDDTYQKLTEKKELYNVMIVRGNKPRLECRKDGVIRVVNICNARNIYMDALEALSAIAISIILSPKRTSPHIYIRPSKRRRT